MLYFITKKTAGILINIVMDQVLEVPWKNEPKGKFKNIFEIPALSNSQSRNLEREN